MKNRYVLDPIDPEETRTIEFPFGPDLGEETLTATPTVSVSVEAGTDELPDDILNGTPDLDEHNLLQSVHNCASGVDYHLRAIGTTPTRTIIVSCTLPCRVK